MAESNKSDLLKELHELILSDVISEDLRVTFVELLNTDKDFRKKFGLKPVTRKKADANIDSPIYSEIVKQLWKNPDQITLALQDASKNLGITFNQVRKFFDKGNNKKNIYSTLESLKNIKTLADICKTLDSK